MEEPKILIFDEEISKTLAYTFDFWEARINPEDIVIPWFMFCISYRWYGQKKLNNISIIDFPRYKRDKYNDIELLKAFSKVINEADVLVGHNITRFDIKKLNARLILKGLPPTKHTETLDTLQMCRKYFGFTHNSLGAVAEALGYKGKTNNEKGLWRKCFEGDLNAHKKMIKYCNNDIDINTFVFEKLMPFIKNRMIKRNGEIKCQNMLCGSDNIQKRGVRNGNQKFSCKDCGSWGQIKL